MTYYFAYGSNLNVEQMKHRCPSAIPISSLVLPNARLVFRNVADVEYDPGASVTGGLWDITDRCEAALDRYEGVKGGLYRKEYITISIREGGKMRERKALIYQMNRSSYSEPGEFYLNSIRKGYKDFGIARELLTEAVEYTKALVVMQRQVDHVYAARAVPNSADVLRRAPRPMTKPAVKQARKAAARQEWYDSDRLPFHDKWAQ